MKKVIRIKFDIKSKLHMTPQLFFHHMPYMLKNFNMVADYKNPDYVIYATRHPKGNYVRIWYTHENHRPRMHDCDWAISFDHNKDPRHLRMPNYVRVGAGRNLLHRKVNVNKVIQQKTKFCNFLYSHSVPFRNKFFTLLSKYKPIDAPGRCCQNMTHIGEYKNAMASRVSAKRNSEKVVFLSPYKFTIAFEHTAHPGYCTEKLYQPFLADSIPIYWGNPLAHKDFNKKKFISCGNMKGMSKDAQLKHLVDKVVAIDKNPNLYAKMLKEPAYPGDTLTPYVDPKKIMAFFRKIFNS